MARRGPTHPDWENPPRLDNYPRLRSHEDRNNNQPLLLAALGVAIVMVALILIPLWGGKGGERREPERQRVAHRGRKRRVRIGDRHAQPDASCPKTMQVYTVSSRTRP